MFVLCGCICDLCVISQVVGFLLCLLLFAMSKSVCIFEFDLFSLQWKEQYSVMFVICFPISLVVSFTYHQCSCGHVCDLFSYLAGCFLYLSLLFVWSCLWFVFLSRWLFPLLFVSVRVCPLKVCFIFKFKLLLYMIEKEQHPGSWVL